MEFVRESGEDDLLHGDTIRIDREKRTRRHEDQIVNGLHRSRIEFAEVEHRCRRQSNGTIHSGNGGVSGMQETFEFVLVVGRVLGEEGTSSESSEPALHNHVILFTDMELAIENIGMRESPLSE